MSPKYGTIIGLTVTSSSDPMSVCNTDGELFLTRSLIETAEPSSQPSTATSSSSSHTPRIASICALPPSSALPAALTSSSNSHKKIE